MGVEVFPKILLFMQIVVGAVGVISVLTIAIATFHFYRAKGDKAKKDEMKGHILNSLIALIIVLIVYFVLSGIGPAFRLLFA